MKKFIYTAAEAEQAVKECRNNFVHSRTMRNIFRIIRAESKKGYKNHTFNFDSRYDAYNVFDELEKLGYKLSLSDPAKDITLWVSW